MSLVYRCFAFFLVLSINKDCLQCFDAMVMCLELGADLRMAQLMPLPLTVSCFSRIQIGFTFLVLTHLGSPGKRAVKRVSVRARARQ